MSDKKICETKDGLVLLNTATHADLKKLGQALEVNTMPNLGHEIKPCTPADLQRVRAQFPKPTKPNPETSR